MCDRRESSGSRHAVNVYTSDVPNNAGRSHLARGFRNTPQGSTSTRKSLRDWNHRLAGSKLLEYLSEVFSIVVYSQTKISARKHHKWNNHWFSLTYLNLVNDVLCPQIGLWRVNKVSPTYHTYACAVTRPP